MKSRISMLLSLLMLVGCSLDYKDEINPAVSDEDAAGKLTVNVCVSGTFASDDALTEAELSVSEYDLLVFDDATGQLQYKETGVVPSKKEAVSGTSDYLLDIKEIELPNTGKKKVFVIANRNSSLEIPELVTCLEDEGGCTLLNEFRDGVVQTLAAAPSSPLVMVGETSVSTSNGTALSVTLARTVAKISVINKDASAIVLNSILVKGAASSVAPLAESGAPVKSDGIEYSPIKPSSSDPCAVFYVLPTVANQMTVTAEGTVNGEAFVAETVVNTDVYADYGCRLEYSVSGAKVKSAFTPAFDVEIIPAISVSGHWLSGTSEITLPYMAEPVYGFTFDVNLEEGSPAAIVFQNEESDWYDVEMLESGKVRVRALKENAGSERKSSFTIASGGNTFKMNVIQQGIADITTVSFCGIEWMDRNVGATLRANMAGSSDIRSYGYLFQWGRNVPFPVEGTVETVAGQMTPAEAMASDKFIVYNEGTQDWNSQGVEGTHEAYWDEVTSNPCPSGYRLPTYSELETILPYRLNALIYASGRQGRKVTKANGETYYYVGVGTGSIKEYQPTGAIRGIMNQGTEDAYHLRWQLNNEGGIMQSDANNGDVNYIAGGKNIVRISYIDGDSSSDFPKGEHMALANEFWNTHTPEQEIYFPCPGRRDATGAIVESGEAGFYWSRSMYKGNKTTEAYASGLFYFRPAGKFMLMVAPAIGTADVYTATEAYGYRNQAFPIRCVKDKQ